VCLSGIVDRVYLLDRGGITTHGTIDEIRGIANLAAAYLAAH
jgi:ABC-type branched-subunit amino acid transport system ATPase component